jgi:adenylate kinase
VFEDGHLSHLLGIDAIVLIRCHPDHLKSRLEARGYDEGKVRSNVEWEMIAGTWSEILEFELDLPILELDGSTTSATELMSEVLLWIEDGCPSDGVEATAAEAIDWLA